VVEGDAVQINDDAVLEPLAEAWAAKWDRRWKFEASSGGFKSDSGGAAPVLSVTPKKILAFGRGNFSQTRYRF
jgi:hypothetical protein